jgi:very-short-patch-repair endonuclease
MARVNAQPLFEAALALAKRQYSVVTRVQLLRLGLTDEAIEHWLRIGRLHRIWAGVYAVGRPGLTRKGYFMAAVLSCGVGALLSHQSAGSHYRILSHRRGPIHVSTPPTASARRRNIKVHRRAHPLVAASHEGIPVTSPIDTLVDLATCLDEAGYERAINEAANRDLVHPELLRDAAAAMRRRPGARATVSLLDRDTYRVTDTRLEQRLLRIVRGAGLPIPRTQRHLGAGRVDFHWDDLRLIAEADSLRFHRTASQQRADRLRDQKHAAAGFTTLRFTHWQIFNEPDQVAATLTAVIRRLEAAALA